MITPYDILYSLAVGFSAPYWSLKPAARDKVRRAFAQRMGRVSPRDASSPAVMIHAVSLGEVNATRSLIESLRQLRPSLRFIVSVTTETGFTRAQILYAAAPDVTIVRYPLDFSSAVNRFLNALRPSVIVLMELEVWPNFLKICHQRHIPVLLINGRVTERSFERYKLAKPLIGWMFRDLAQVCAQDQLYASRFQELGARRISVTGTMKFDTAQVLDNIHGQETLANTVSLKPGQEPILVCGSTGPGEEEIILTQFRQLLQKFPTLRLVLVPRKPERFNEVAQLITSVGFPLIRLSNPTTPASTNDAPIILGDTIGDLSKFYAIADVVFVGRSIVDLGARQHGSDMIEPAALAKPIIVGPFTGNFAEAMEYFRVNNALIIIKTPSDLGQAVNLILSDRPRSVAMAQRARKVVQDQRGATTRHAQIILQTLDAMLKN